jgi:hypothetical protein
LYHWGISFVPQTAVKFTVPLNPVFTHTEPPTTFPAVGGTGMALTINVTGFLEPWGVSQVVTVFLQPIV